MKENDNTIILHQKMSKRIKEQRLNQKVTLKQIASYLNISESRYKKIEACTNKSIEISLLKQLADRFECTYDYLILESDDPKTFSDGNQFCCSFKSKQDMLQTIVTYFEEQDDVSLLRDLSYAITTLPNDYCKNLQNILHTCVILDQENKKFLNE